MKKQPTLIVIAGPTAVGKTKFAIQLAQHFNTEIISADSRQFYKEMIIGTAKPTKSELAQVKHHFVNNLSIKDKYSAGKFEKDVLALLTKRFEKQPNVPMLMAGGSGLFIQAVCKGFDDLPEIDKRIRTKVKEQYNSKGITFLQEQLALKDPEYYKEADIQNPQRLMRAIEVIESTGKPFSFYRNKQNRPRDFKTVYIGLHLDREILYTRINKRVDKMIDLGLLDEVRSLIPYQHLNALQTVGYKTLFDYFNDIHTLDEAVELIKRNTRRYAKRQLTWFRRIEQMHWFQPNQIDEVTNALENRIL